MKFKIFEIILNLHDSSSRKDNQVGISQASPLTQAILLSTSFWFPSEDQDLGFGDQNTVTFSDIMAFGNTGLTMCFHCFCFVGYAEDPKS